MRTRGFTLLELMIVLAVLGIVTGISAAALRPPRRQTTAPRDPRDSLRTAAARTGRMAVAADSTGALHVALPDGRSFPTRQRAPHE